MHFVVKNYILVIVSVIFTILIADAFESTDSILYGAITGFLVYWFVQKPLAKKYKDY